MSTAPLADLVSWHPRLHPLTNALLVGLLAWWAYDVFSRIRVRMSKKRAVFLALPKIVLLLLFIVALSDPSCTRSIPLDRDRVVVALVDRSSSMDVADRDGTSRFARARALLASFGDALGASARLTTFLFDTELHPGTAAAPDAEGVRGTDLGACIRTLNRDVNLGAADAVVLLTDGGDESPQHLPAPDGAPLHIVGFGGEPDTWQDVEVADVRCPSSVEAGAAFNLAVEVLRRRTTVPHGGAVDLRLERKKDGAWQTLARKDLPLPHLRATTHFYVTLDEVGLQEIRVLAETGIDEISKLNNVRVFPVEVRKGAVHVLFFTRTLSSRLKTIRSELGADPGIAFTALFRSVGERFTVQGARLPGEDASLTGFPDEAEALSGFDCLILGSFPAGEWRDSQMRALVEYVEKGGAVVFLGGPDSFGSGHYDATPLAALFPWDAAAGERGLVRGRYPVSVPPTVRSHPVVAGVADRLSGAGHAVVESFNPIGAPKLGATVLLQVSVGKRTRPLVGLQRYGKGHALAIASNTLWKWARGEPGLRDSHGLFWRQAVRNLAGAAEGGELLRVRWDKTHYRPGEAANGDIRVTGREGALRLGATVGHAGLTRPVPVDPAQGREHAYRVRLRFAERGIHTFALTAFAEENVLETYRKTFPVGPRLNEGARLELDEGFLAALAKDGGGVYAHETEADTVREQLTRRGQTRTIRSQTSLVHGVPYLALLFVGVLVWEWVVRRMMNLL